MQAWTHIRFGAIIVWRWIKILFRTHKKIECEYIEYSTRYLFDDSYFLIYFRFKNALWYKFRHIKTTTKDLPVVINIKNLKGSEIELVVYGFGGRKQYNIEVTPGHAIIRKRFVTKILFSNSPQHFTSTIKTRLKILGVKHFPIKTNAPFIKFNPTSYTQTDFL